MNSQVQPVIQFISLTPMNIHQIHSGGWGVSLFQLGTKKEIYNTWLEQRVSQKVFIMACLKFFDYPIIVLFILRHYALSDMKLFHYSILGVLFQHLKNILHYLSFYTVSLLHYFDLIFSIVTLLTIIEDPTFGCPHPVII